jgi:hypothetical protein
MTKSQLRMMGILIKRYQAESMRDIDVCVSSEKKRRYNMYGQLERQKQLIMQYM